MNRQTDAKTGELYVADADIKTNVAYALPVDLAKSLRCRPALPYRQGC
jgi:hypothetical protein